MSIRLVLADDHPLILQALTHLFCPEDGFQVLAACADGHAALQAVQRESPDILILDVYMPGNEDLAVLRTLAEKPSPTRVILLTAILEEQEMLEAVQLGVWAVLLKDMASERLVQCVQRVYAGERWFERQAIGEALQTVVRRETGQRARLKLLTSREHEMVRQVARGLRNRAVAQTLGISEGTVKLHLHHIYTKLRLDSRTALILYAQEHGLV